MEFETSAGRIVSSVKDPSPALADLGERSVYYAMDDMLFLSGLLIGVLAVVGGVCLNVFLVWRVGKIYVKASDQMSDVVEKGLTAI